MELKMVHKGDASGRRTLKPLEEDVIAVERASEERLIREERLRKKDIWENLKEIITIKTIQYEQGGSVGFAEKKKEVENRVEIRRNFIGMEFVLIPAGEFEMGSPLSEKDRGSDEGAVHRVKIEKSFYMGRYEVTLKEWREVMGNNPSSFNYDDLPIEKVSWDDVQKFIKKLNEKEGTDKYRLPSEAEWEYACRAGTTTRYSFIGSESELGNYAWYRKNSCNKTHLVGKKKPNPWGLYDMHGNVWEWTQDIKYSNYNGAPTDGGAWESGCGAYRVVRGGSWSYFAGGCRSASRSSGNPVYRSPYIGFRLLKGT